MEVFCEIDYNFRLKLIMIKSLGNFTVFFFIENHYVFLFIMYIYFCFTTFNFRVLAPQWYVCATPTSHGII